MSELKNPLREASLLLLPQNCEVGTNFTFFYEAELLKLGVFGTSFVKLGSPKQVLSPAAANPRSPNWQP
jgi:hypothetical protein